MRITPLTEKVAERLLANRRRRDGAAERTAARIIRDVRRRGDQALASWTRRLDGVNLETCGLWVTPQEFRLARDQIDNKLLRAIRHAARNVRRVARQQKPRSWQVLVEPGVRVGQAVRPLDSVGCYIPGGRYSLVSTLLMTVIPARVAGVGRIMVACPRPNTALLAVADLLGVKKVARVGGAQAIAALAYGTKAILPVDKIVGPGNRFVTAAKQLVSGDCAIDFPAGPTEVLVMAREGNPRFMAADIIAQAEHDLDVVALFLTTSRRLAVAVRDELRKQLSLLPRANPARRSLRRHGALLLARNWRAALAFANRYAPEHLSLPDGDRELPTHIRAAGTVFLGPWSAQSVGDYASGSNHVLPTSGWARARGGLSVADFVRFISVQSVSRPGLGRLMRVVRSLAGAEQLTAHARAAEVRQ
jgi:histidinol dehydrogenase